MVYFIYQFKNPHQINFQFLNHQMINLKIYFMIFYFIIITITTTINIIIIIIIIVIFMFKFFV